MVTRPRVWLAAREQSGTPAPSAVLRDNVGRIWVPDGRGGYRTEDGHHHTTLDELRAATDLVEVVR